MKIVIASDLHGSVYYTERVLAYFRDTQAQLLVLLGDIYNHGPRNPFPKDYAPMRVAELLNAVTDRMIVVKGNCDSEVDQMISSFTFVPMAQLYADGRIATCTHGHVYHRDALPPCVGNILFYGHYHVAFAERQGDIVVANPGSAALPKENMPHSCMLLDESGIVCHDLDTGEQVFRLDC